MGDSMGGRASKYGTVPLCVTLLDFIIRTNWNSYLVGKYNLPVVSLHGWTLVIPKHASHGRVQDYYNNYCYDDVVAEQHLLSQVSVCAGMRSVSEQREQGSVQIQLQSKTFLKKRTKCAVSVLTPSIMVWIQSLSQASEARASHLLVLYEFNLLF